MVYPEIQLFINGQWHSKTNSGFGEIQNPATGEVIGTYPIAGDEELALSVIAAKESFQLWSQMLALDRYRIMTHAAQLLRERVVSISKTLTLEQGKPLSEAVREVQLSADIIDFLSEEAKRLASRGVPPRLANIQSQTVLRVPVGVVAAFTPWNFPANLPARKIAGALAAGCTVIIKPSEETPATCMAIVQAFADAGLPAGVLNMVLGEPSHISSTLIGNDSVAKISFTGSVAVGKMLGEQAARKMLRYTAELGGHAPVIVCSDADGAAVAELAVPAKFRNSGQVCASPIRFLVHRSQYEKFKAQFISGTAALKLGNGLDVNTTFGPLIHERRVEEMQHFVDNSVACGAKLLCGGSRVDGPGSFYAPTVLEAAPMSAHVQTQEPFGPIALLDIFDDLDDAIERANALPYGLAAYAFTSDLNSAHQLSSRLEAGMVGINHFGVSQPETPFGGIKDSGLGSESGLEGLLSYTEIKLVSIANAP